MKSKSGQHHDSGSKKRVVPVECAIPAKLCVDAQNMIALRASNGMIYLVDRNCALVSRRCRNYILACEHLIASSIMADTSRSLIEGSCTSAMLFPDAAGNDSSPGAVEPTRAHATLKRNSATTKRPSTHTVASASRSSASPGHANSPTHSGSNAPGHHHHTHASIASAAAAAAAAQSEQVLCMNDIYATDDMDTQRARAWAYLTIHKGGHGSGGGAATIQNPLPYCRLNFGNVPAVRRNSADADADADADAAAARERQSQPWITGGDDGASGDAVSDCAEVIEMDVSCIRVDHTSSLHVSQHVHSGMVDSARPLSSVRGNKHNSNASNSPQWSSLLVSVRDTAAAPSTWTAARKKSDSSEVESAEHRVMTSWLYPLIDLPDVAPDLLEVGIAFMYYKYKADNESDKRAPFTLQSIGETDPVRLIAVSSLLSM